MHVFDSLTLAAYLILIVGLGTWFGRQQSRSEFFMAGRSMGWFVVGLSVMATLFSSNSFVFYPSASFADSLRIGLALVAFALMTPIVMYVFIPVYARLNVETAYEYLERRFHVSVRLLASGLFILLRIGWMASATYAASVVVAPMVGLHPTQVIVGLGAAAIGYTMLGGLRAVMWTDVIQFFVFAATIIATLSLICSAEGTGLFELWDRYMVEHKQPLVNWEPSLSLKYGSWAILIGFFLESLSAFGVDQVAVQRYLAADSERTSQRGAILNLLAMWIVIPGLLLIGVALYGWYSSHPAELATIAVPGSEVRLSDIETVETAIEKEPKIADRALPGFVDTHFPPGLKGLFLAALMAAIMSSIDSGIHSVTTALVVDFRDRLMPAWRPVSETRELFIIRILIVTVGSAAVGIACLVDPQSSVFEVSRKLTAAFGAPLLAIFILAFFSSRATWQAVMLSALISTAATLYLMYTRKDWFSAWYWPLGFGLALIGGYAGSLLQKPTDSAYTFARIMKSQSESNPGSSSAATGMSSDQ